MVQQLSLVSSIPENQFNSVNLTLSTLTGMSPKPLTVHTVILKPKFPYTPQYKTNNKPNQIEQYRLRMSRVWHTPITTLDNTTTTPATTTSATNTDQAKILGDSIFDEATRNDSIWTIQLSDIPAAGKRIVSTQAIYETTIFETDDIIGYVDELGFIPELEFWNKGVRFYYNDLIIEIFRLYVKSPVQPPTAAEDEEEIEIEVEEEIEEEEVNDQQQQQPQQDPSMANNEIVIPDDDNNLPQHNTDKEIIDLDQMDLDLDDIPLSEQNKQKLKDGQSKQKKQVQEQLKKGKDSKPDINKPQEQTQEKSQSSQQQQEPTTSVKKIGKIKKIKKIIKKKQSKPLVLQLLDKITGKYFIKVYINVARLNDIDNIVRATKQLELFKNEISGLFELEIPDRNSMDSRINSKLASNVKN
ncbi:hypothetical protein B5S33_g201 [[Candida] boidinii]|nr:hypothetical protein B5S33_g201 [[Candida] boidinii]